MWNKPPNGALAPMTAVAVKGSPGAKTDYPREYSRPRSLDNHRTSTITDRAEAAFLARPLSPPEFVFAKDCR